MAVRQGFETLDFNPTSVDQLMVPIKMQADTNALYGNILSSIKEQEDYLTPAIEDTKLEYQNKVGNITNSLVENMRTNKNVSFDDIDKLREARANYQSFYSPGGIGYQRMIDKKKYQTIQKNILENKDISAETKKDWLNLAMINYKNNFKNGYDFEDIIPAKEIDLAKLGIDIASKIEKMTRSIQSGASQDDIRRMAETYGIPIDSAAFQVLTETETRTPQKIYDVLSSYFMSSKDVQDMLRQNQLLSQVNPNRISNEDLVKGSIKTAIDAASVNNLKQREIFKFKPKYLYKGSGTGSDVEIGDIAYINTDNSGELEKGFWGKIGNLFNGEKWSAKKTKKEFTDDMLKELNVETSSYNPNSATHYGINVGRYSTSTTSTRLKGNELIKVVDDIQKKWGFNDSIKDTVLSELQNGTNIENIGVLKEFIENMYDLKGNVKVTGAKITGTNQNIKNKFNTLTMDIGERNAKIIKDGKVSDDKVRIQEIIGNSKNMFQNGQYIPSRNAFIYNYLDEDGKLNSAEFKLTPHEMQSATGGKAIPVSEEQGTFGILSKNSKGDSIALINNGLDKYGKESYIIQYTDENGTPTGTKIMIDSSDPNYSNYKDQANELNAELVSAIFKKNK